MIGNLIAAIVIGIIAGYVAKALLPGDDPGGFIVTVLLGIAGAVIGFYLFRALGIGDSDKFDLGGVIGAIIGTMILLLLYRVFVGRTAGPARR